MMNSGLIAGISSFLSSVAEEFTDGSWGEMRVFLGRHGFEFLGGGISRQTFAHPLVPDVVFKLEVNSLERQSEMEYTTWMSSTSVMKEYLAEIFHYEDGVTVQERITGPRQKDIHDVYEFFELEKYTMVHRLYRKTPGLHDAHSENYLYDPSRDKMILVDYGGGCG